MRLREFAAAGTADGRMRRVTRRDVPRDGLGIRMNGRGGCALGERNRCASDQKRRKKRKSATC